MSESSNKSLMTGSNVRVSSCATWLTLGYLFWGFFPAANQVITFWQNKNFLIQLTFGHLFFIYFI